VAGGRWQVGGGRWEVAGGSAVAAYLWCNPVLVLNGETAIQRRWQVAGGWWPVADGRWQVAGGRW
jgi:hypothetical protein